MLSKYALPVRARLTVATALVAAFALSLAVAGTASAAAPAVGSFQKRASSPHPVNNVAVDPTTNMIYAQQFEGKGFYRYNPRTNKWTTLAKAPINQGNNGGAAYVKGKIYTVYTNNDTQMGVYDIATGTWSTTTNPLASGDRRHHLSHGPLVPGRGVDLCLLRPGRPHHADALLTTVLVHRVRRPGAVQGEDLRSTGQ